MSGEPLEPRAGLLEPAITINGERLTEGQAMAVRVAVASFLMSLTGTEEALGSDEHGRRMAAGYRDRLREVARLMLGA